MALLISQLIEPVTQVEPISQHIGTFTSPVRLPVVLNILIGVGAVAASMERALRLRFGWLLDGKSG
ncbi:hypothetical protein ACFP2T_17705 [Plantactinospora solaniradicis]|uniref:Uncharacterized protein n=1 Tax=Plantactinospora solaniradicis TaxID=1723736 RepID=A0ABW1K9T2_9ACTN